MVDMTQHLWLQPKYNKSKTLNVLSEICMSLQETPEAALKL